MVFLALSSSNQSHSKNFDGAYMGRMRYLIAILVLAFLFGCTGKAGFHSANSEKTKGDKGRETTGVEGVPGYFVKPGLATTTFGNGTFTVTCPADCVKAETATLSELGIAIVNAPLDALNELAKSSGTASLLANGQVVATLNVNSDGSFSGTVNTTLTANSLALILGAKSSVVNLAVVIPNNADKITAAFQLIPTSTAQATFDSVFSLAAASPLRKTQGVLSLSGTSSFNLNTNTNGDQGRSIADGVNFTVATNTLSGQNRITLAATPSGLAVGDEVAIINAQGTAGNASNVGQYELQTVAGIDGPDLIFSTPLKNTYDGTTQKIVVQRVPYYSELTIGSSATLTANAWNGTKGGFLFARVLGSASVQGAIDMKKKGFRASDRQVANSKAERYDGITISHAGSGPSGGSPGLTGLGGSKGTGFNGAGDGGAGRSGDGGNVCGGGGGGHQGGDGGHPGAINVASNLIGLGSGAGMGGGGGGGSGHVGGGGAGGGGGGGAGINGVSGGLGYGNAGDGGVGNASFAGGGGGIIGNGATNAAGPGGGQTDYPAAHGGVGGNLSQSGGDGNYWGFSSNYAGSTGEAGGGVVYLAAGNISVSGTISANGGNGGNGGQGYGFGCAGGGGSGGGGKGASAGAIILSAGSLDLGSNKVTAVGGNGGLGGISTGTFTTGMVGDNGTSGQAGSNGQIAVTGTVANGNATSPAFVAN